MSGEITFGYTPPVTYRIRDWNDIFENNKSREREQCSFCCIPNKQDGLGYGTLIRLPNGEALYGAFCAVALMASKQKRVNGRGREGYLTHDGLPDGRPLNARQMSMKCQFSEKTISDMLQAVSSQDIEWVDVITNENTTKQPETPTNNDKVTQVPAECPPSALERRERIEEKEWKGTPADDVAELPPKPPAPAKPKTTNAALPHSKADYVVVFKSWNSTAKDTPNMPQTLLISDKRKNALQVRLGEKFFADNWLAALVKVSKSAFCLGENKTGWKASFDWFISRDAVVKIMEGKYDNSTPSQTKTAKPNDRNFGVGQNPTQVGSDIEAAIASAGH